MLEEGVLDLDAVHVLPATDDHVLGPVDDVDESLLVDAGHVAGVEPAPGEGEGGVLGSVPVATHHVGALDPKLTRPFGIHRLVGRGLVAGVLLGHHGHVAHRGRRPHAVGLADVVVTGVHGGHGRALGQAVAVARGAAGEVLFDATHQV